MIISMPFINAYINDEYCHRFKVLSIIQSYQLKLITMRTKLANLNHCAVPFLSRATPTCAGTTIYTIYYILYTIY